MFSRRVSQFVAIGCAALFLTACDSSEERAEEHYKSGIALLEAGDVERAIVEFRNVLSLNEFHREARAAFATAIKERGDLTGAYSQFLRLSEEDPNDMESRIQLASMAISVQNWDEAERHTEALRNANAEVDGLDAVDAVMRYRDAALAEDQSAMRQIAQEIETLSDTYPEDTNLLRILIEVRSREGDMEGVLETIDRAIEVEPDTLFYYSMKAGALAEQERYTDLEAHLRVMLERFPGAENVSANLVRLLVASGQLERAEEFLRDEIARSETPVDVHVGLIAFLRQIEGDEAALEEIEAALPLYENNATLRALRAGIAFDNGDREDAIAEMEDAIASSAPSERLDRLKIAMAKMLLADGNEVGARTIVGEVLESDPSQVDALKMSANWQIQADETNEAISSLRLALDQEPQDTETMSLLAQAHQRAGEFELAQDLLALAAETSNYAAEESSTFARELMSNERFRPAEDVLINALRRSPDDMGLLRLLADVYLADEDWARLRDVENSFRRIGSPEAVSIANDLQLQVLARTQGQGQAQRYLESLAEDDSLGLGPRLRLLSTRIEAQDAEGALDLAREITGENPDSPQSKMLIANTQLGLGQYAEAETTLTELVEDVPQFEQAWIQLVRAQSAQDKRDMARKTVDDALEASPGSANLKWAKASYLEQSNDIDGAIEIYEELYASNSQSPVIANNLASLLVTHRDDQASLDRAFTIGRRLRGTEFAPFQDTYGWILFRRGEFEEAVTYLEPAAEAIPGDALVQYHLAEAYKAAGSKLKALEQYKRAIEIAGADDPRPQIVRALEEVEKLSVETSE